MLIELKDLIKKYHINPTGVLHVGANVGEERFSYAQCGIDDVVWIEANSDIFKQLQQNIRKYPYHLAFNKCIGDVDGKEVTFNISNNGSQSSSVLELEYHKIAHKEVHYIDHVPMKTTRIDTLFKENNLSIVDYDFLNCDLQGNEGAALVGMGELLHKVNYAYLELNEKELYKGCWLMPQVDAYMESFGFKRVELAKTGFFWHDGFYLRK